jgi:hypothetical protein
MSARPFPLHSLTQPLTLSFSLDNRIDNTFAYDDTLFRGLLGLPQEPAVIRVSVLALAFEDLARGLVSSLVMSNFFDVPIIS